MSAPIFIKSNYIKNDLPEGDPSYGCLRPCIRKTSKVAVASTRIAFGALIGAVLGGTLAFISHPIPNPSLASENTKTDLHTQIQALYETVLTGAKLGASLGVYIAFTNETI